MGIVSDVRGKPGDIVTPRGGQPIATWRGFGNSSPDHRAGVVMPRAIGIIIATHVTAWTYVMWSMPNICGWNHDGELRVLKVKT